MRVSVVLAGLSADTMRLQPWRSLTQVAVALASAGHSVELLTDRPIGGVAFPSVRLTTRAARVAWPEGRLAETAPDVVIWNTGATSLIRRRTHVRAGARHVAIFTSPLYRPADLLRVGGDLRSDPWSYAANGLGALLPRRLLAHRLAHAYDQVIFLAQSAAQALVEAGFPRDRALVVAPGRDADLQPAPPTASDLAAPEAPVSFLFAGSPAPIRGADLLLRAFAAARQSAPQARLVVLSRHERPALATRSADLVRLATRLDLLDTTEFVFGMLPRAEFLDRLRGADVMVLPFRLVPSEAPLAVIEAAGVGLPLIASDLAPIRDLAAPGSLLVRPVSVDALRDAIVRLATDPTARQIARAQAIAWHATWPTWAVAGARLATAIETGRPAVTAVAASPSTTDCADRAGETAA
jgi:glycosyltransferase involved in cell wall biosynthesis